MENRGHLTNHPPTSSCPRGCWMTPSPKLKLMHVAIGPIRALQSQMAEFLILKIIHTLIGLRKVLQVNYKKLRSDPFAQSYFVLVI